jgi:hypothetical protein
MLWVHQDVVWLGWTGGSPRFESGPSCQFAAWYLHRYRPVLLHSISLFIIHGHHPTSVVNFWVSRCVEMVTIYRLFDGTLQSFSICSTRRNTRNTRHWNVDRRAVWPQKNTTFWDTAPYSLVEVDRRFRIACCPDDGGSTHLWNVRAFTSLYCAIAQKAVLFILASVRTWNITYFTTVWESSVLLHNLRIAM